MDSKNNGARKKTLGRRRIEIKRISDINSRQVTFSKRRMGLFRKASELCILTGTQIAIIVHSPGNHVYSFGHPNVKSVINRYLHIQGLPNYPSSSSPSCNYDAMMNKKHNYAVVKRELEVVKNTAKIKKEVNLWWNEGIENLGVNELEQHLAALEELKKKVSVKADQLKDAKTAAGWCLVPVAS